MLEHPAQQIAMQEYILAIHEADARHDRLVKQIEGIIPTWSIAPSVTALQAMRGIAMITAATKLQKRYPQVCSPETLEALFDRARATDLYFEVVMKATEWPTNDQSIKTLAKSLEFAWRDDNPSGAASIEYCKATRVLLDGIRQLT